MDMNFGKLWEMVRLRKAWLQSVGSQKVRHDLATEQQAHYFLRSLLYYKLTPLAREGRAWWAAVCGVTQSRTRLKRLSSSSKGQK